ncbi:MAG: hypothetical protein ACM3Y9_15350 [Ignavibacteria bacterium]
MEAEDLPPRRLNPQLLLIGGAAAFFVVLLALTIALAMIFALRDDIANLEEQARRSVKATKALQEEVEALRAQAAALAASRRPAEPAPQNIDAADTSADCVVRPGAKGGLAECMNLAPR